MFDLFNLNKKTKSNRKKQSHTKKRGLSYSKTKREHHHNHSKTKKVHHHNHSKTKKVYHHTHSIRFIPRRLKPVFPGKGKKHHNYIPPNKLYLGNKEILYSYDLWIDVNKNSKNNNTIMNLLNYIHHYYFMKPLLPKNYLEKRVYDIELLFNNTINGFNNVPMSTNKYKKVKRNNNLNNLFHKTLGLRTFYKLFFFHYINNMKMELLINNNGIEMGIPIKTDTTILLENGLKYRLKIHKNMGNTKFKLTVLDLLI